MVWYLDSHPIYARSQPGRIAKGAVPDNEDWEKTGGKMEKR